MSKLISVLIESASFIAAIAGIAAAIVMANIKKKFGSGILASGFKTISAGVLILAFGIIFDAINTYIQLAGIIVIGIVILKEVLFVTGTYIIIVGTKTTADKLESLTK